MCQIKFAWNLLEIFKKRAEALSVLLLSQLLWPINISVFELF